MHETENHDINIIYNHNFKQSLIFIVQDSRNQHYTKSFESELQTTKKNSILLPRKAYFILPTLL